MEEKKIRPQDKWDAKAGMVPKTYKVKKRRCRGFCKGLQRKQCGSWCYAVTAHESVCRTK